MTNRACLRFTDPHLLVYDGLNGSGHDVRVKGEIIFRFGREELRDGIMSLDHQHAPGGYTPFRAKPLH